MKIFYYTWFENSENDLMEALVRLGHCVIKCHIPFKDYEDDKEFTEELERIVTEHGCDLFFSFDFFPAIAKTAHHLKKRYVSWIYDMPHLTLYSPAVKSEYSSVFVFDRMQYMQLEKIKPSHLYYLPLAVNTCRLNKMLGEFCGKADYSQDITFVGSLYEKNGYRQIQYLPDYLKGYINGIIEAQQKIYGCNFVEEMLTEDIVEQFQKYASLNMYDSYQITEKQLYADLINAEITAQERKNLIKALAEKYRCTLYTASDADLIPKAEKGGIISYYEEMPQVFRSSRINLNITLRSIVSGIPLRALDIMGAGGFLLSNYQAELAEHFEDGKELVLFDSREDMLAKAEYYLQHEEEREEIAHHGWEKVQKYFSYDIQLEKIFKMIAQE